MTKVFGIFEEYDFKLILTMFIIAALINFWSRVASSFFMFGGSFVLLYEAIFSKSEEVGK